MRWRWHGETDISPFTRVYEVNVADGRAYVHMGSHGTRYDWFVMDLAGVENGMRDWIQVTRGGAIMPELRSSEHFQKGETYVHPSYMAEKFPGASDPEYEEMGGIMIPFLVQVLEMEPLPESAVA